MSFLNFCCICMNKSDLKHLFDVDNDGVSHYNKLTSSIAEMNFKEMNDQRLICGECCVTLNTVYNFRQTCLRGKTNLITYLSQLQTYSHVTGKTYDPLKDISPESIFVKEEIEIKCEKEDGGNSIEANVPSEYVNYEESILFPASVKEEYESEEEASSAHEDATADHVNEGDVKVEDDEHGTLMEEEHYTEFTKIDIEDRSIKVKNEPLSVSETPQDGSTSQVDAETSGELKESIESIVGMESEQNTEINSYECEICKKSYNQKGNLTRHMRIHTTDGPFDCEICGKRFGRKCNLIIHARIHSGEKPYECEICKKTFRHKSTLCLHVKIHSDDRKHECKVCKKTFIYKAVLTTHMLIHSGEKPHACDVCKKSFNQKSNLTKHKLIHSGEKPYECEICKKTFNQKSNLTNHKQIHLNQVDKPYEYIKVPN